MRPEVEAAVAQLRSEIDTLAASVLARKQMAVPEILTHQRISIGSARAAVLTTEPAAAPALESRVAPTVESKIAEPDRIAPNLTQRSAGETGILRRFIARVWRILRWLA